MEFDEYHHVCDLHMIANKNVLTNLKVFRKFFFFISNQQVVPDHQIEQTKQWILDSTTEIEQECAGNTDTILILMYCSYTCACGEGREAFYDYHSEVSMD